MLFGDALGTKSGDEVALVLAERSSDGGALSVQQTDSEKSFGHRWSEAGDPALQRGINLTTRRVLIGDECLKPATKLLAGGTIREGRNALVLFALVPKLHIPFGGAAKHASSVAIRRLEETHDQLLSLVRQRGCGRMASQRSRFGAPAASQSSRVFRFQRVDRPRRIGRGNWPAL